MIHPPPPFIHWVYTQNDHCIIITSTLRLRQNGCHFPDNILKWIFLNQDEWLSIKIHWSLFLGVQLTIFEHWFRLWLDAGQATSHYLNQCRWVYWRIYVSLGLNELRSCQCPLSWSRQLKIYNCHLREIMIAIIKLSLTHAYAYILDIFI